MTQALMGLAPDRKQLSAEAKEAELFYRMTKSELQDKAKTIAVQLSEFTKYVVALVLKHYNNKWSCLIACLFILSGFMSELIWEIIHCNNTRQIDKILSVT